MCLILDQDLFSHPDSMQRRILAEIKLFTDWLTTGLTGKGMIGEYSWPGLDFNASFGADHLKWNTLGHVQQLQLEKMDLYGAYFAAGVYGGDGTSPSIYGAGARKYTPTRVLERHLPAARFGVNQSGAFWGRPSFVVGSAYSNNNPGVNLTDYYFDADSTYWNAVGASGYGYVRFPVCWERLQPTLGATLSASHLALLDAQITAMASMKTLIGLFWQNQYLLYDGSTLVVSQPITLNAAAQAVTVSGGVPAWVQVGNVISIDSAGSQEYVTVTAKTGTTISGIFLKSHITGLTATNQGVGRQVGDASGLLTTAHFTDLWTRMVTKYGTNANVLGYELDNEPSTMTKAAYETLMQAGVNAIRTAEGVGTHKLIVIPLMNTGGGRSAWETVHSSGPWIVDSANNFRYDIHLYFDQGLSGNYSRSYAAENTWAAGQGF